MGWGFSPSSNLSFPKEVLVMGPLPPQVYLERETHSWQNDFEMTFLL